MGQRYIIREHSFGYSDECVYAENSHIEDVYDDLGAAESELRVLEVGFLRGFDRLGEHESFFDASREHLAAVDRFVLERTGEHFFADWKKLEAGGHPDCREAELPRGMSDDDLFEFGRIADVHGYELIEIEEDGSLYVVWDPRRDEPVLEHDECGGSYLVYAESMEAFAESALDMLGRHVYRGIELEGTAGELSENPVLLEQLVASTRGLSWNVGKGRLVVKESVPKGKLRSLNALLRVPMLDLRPMEPEALARLERKVA